jgi:hypothetical protein
MVCICIKEITILKFPSVWKFGFFCFETSVHGFVFRVVNIVLFTFKFELFCFCYCMLRN